jgi:hypothetical protein
VVVFGTPGFVSLIPGARVVFSALTVCLAVRAALWHLLGKRRFLLDRQLVQARRSIAGRGWIGTAYFGWILGLTMFTQMTTPVVQAIAVSCAAAGPVFAMATGLGFGVARSVDAWRGALSRDASDPGYVVGRYINASRGAIFRASGVAVSLTLICADMVWNLGR